jgi:superfamily II DNA or RNA helicase
MVIAASELRSSENEPAVSMVGSGFDRSHAKQFGIDPATLIDRLMATCQAQARPYQRRIITSALQMFAGTYKARSGSLCPASNSVLIESPTGSGKTVMGLATAAIIQRATGASIGWVAMRRNLLAQVEAENQLRGFGVEFQTISMFEKQPPQVDLLIVDEAQHDAATSMANLHCHIRPTWTLGLSATPYRSDRIKLCFDSVIRDAGIASLIADGYLSPYHHYTLPEFTPQSVARLLIDDPQRWGKSLVFFHKREQCDLLKLLLLQEGIACDVVTATSPREAQLAAFMAGKTQVLINMAILTEGFDCPELKTVFCRPSGKGCTIQMAGRVLRRSPLHPYKQIVQCRHTPHPMLKTAMAAEQYLWTDHGWGSIRANAALNDMTLAARHRVANATAQLPKLVAIHRTRRAGWWGREEN